MSFWQETENPFFILAPMEDVTDTVFREILLSVSDPSVLNVLFTEFTSVDGLLDDRGMEKVSQRLIVNDSEQYLLKTRNAKLVAQIWGDDPEKFYKVAQMLSKDYIFDGIDINMGCPVKNVVKRATCSALIKYPQLANEIVLATKEGTHLPVSVKTRIGFNEIVTEPWITNLLKTKPAAITIHGRTQKQLSNGEANYHEIAKAVDLRNNLSPQTRIIGNGDIESYTQGMDRIQNHQLDGVMVGRGIFKNPWMFAKQVGEITTYDRLNLLQKHIELFHKTWSTTKNPNVLKRFFKIYLNGFNGAGQLRAELMKAKSYDDFFEFVKPICEPVN